MSVVIRCDGLPDGKRIEGAAVEYVYDAECTIKKEGKQNCRCEEKTQENVEREAP